MTELQQKHRQKIAEEAATCNPIATSTTGKTLVGIDLILTQLEEIYQWTTDLGFPHTRATSTVQHTALPEHPNLAKDVEVFHHNFKIEYTGKCRMLPESINMFREKRLHEELKEYIEADTLEKKLDAIVDLIYIALGNAQLHGFTPAIFNEAWNRVHAANMRKELSSDKNPGKYGKLGDKIDIVKPKDWVAPVLTDLVKGDNA